MNDSGFIRDGEWVFWVLLVVPALIGMFALFRGISILRDQSRSAEKNDLKKALAIFSLIVALGIGACYGMMGLRWLRF
jgi:hypothetical protein